MAPWWRENSSPNACSSPPRARPTSCASFTSLGIGAAVRKSSGAARARVGLAGARLITPTRYFLERVRCAQDRLSRPAARALDRIRGTDPEESSKGESRRWNVERSGRGHVSRGKKRLEDASRLG